MVSIKIYFVKLTDEIMKPSKMLTIVVQHTMTDLEALKVVVYFVICMYPLESANHCVYFLCFGVLLQ